MTALPFHPLANIFPLIEGAEFDELVASVRDGGFMIGEEIVLLDGMILDGRNRYRAAVAAGIFPEDVDPKTRWEFVNFSTDGMDGVFDAATVERGPLAFVIAKNLRRRHLNDGQRASVAAKIATLARGRPAENRPDGLITLDTAAETLNVAPRQVRRARVVHEHGVAELREALDRGDLPVATAERIARLPEAEQQKEIGEINGARAIMARRHEPDDSLDYFPTPPWATRALIERVLPHAGVNIRKLGTVWEPACGEGHMAEVLGEYFRKVVATDIHPYGYEEQELDFLMSCWREQDWMEDWVITNPPFGEKATQFVLRALEFAREGVAMFFRSQWAVEGIDRYETIFRDKPPTLCAFFVERVNLCKGRWDPTGTTATAYCWLIWKKHKGKLFPPMPPLWIPPGCREALSKAEDAERFTAHPVIRRPTPAAPRIQFLPIEGACCERLPDPSSSAVRDGSEEDVRPRFLREQAADAFEGIPDFLRRKKTANDAQADGNKEEVPFG